MKLRLWRNQSIRVNKKAPLLADQNQNARHQRQDAGHDHGDTDVKESHDSNKDQIDGEQKHSEIFGDVHESFLSQPPSFCTLKKAGEGKRLFIFTTKDTKITEINSSVAAIAERPILATNKARESRELTRIKKRGSHCQKVRQSDGPVSPRRP